MAGRLVISGAMAGGFLASSERGPLSEEARALGSEALRARTRHAYVAALEAFELWCGGAACEGCDLGRVVRPRSIWDPASVAEWVTHRAHHAAVGPSSIRVSLAALKLAYRYAGRPDPALVPDVERTIRGALRKLARANPEGRARALRRDDWAAACRALVALSKRSDPERAAIAIRDRAVLVIGFLAGLRRSELAALDRGDLSLADDRGLVVTVRTSKRSDRPVEVALPRGADRATDPVRAWVELEAVRAPDPVGLVAPAFQRVTSHRARRLEARRLGDGHAIERIVRDALRLALVEDAGSYSAHSLRAGLATELAEAGASMASIATAGRWSSLDVVLGYASRATRWSDNALHALRY